MPNYIVRKPGSNAMIRLRSSPSTKEEAIAYLRPDTIVVSAKECTDEWCKVIFRDLGGWIYREFLQPTDRAPAFAITREGEQSDGEAKQGTSAGQSAPAGEEAGKPVEQASQGRSFSVVGLNASSLLMVRGEPQETAPVVGELSPGTVGIEDLGKCDRQWCHIRIEGITGYALRRFLARASNLEAVRYRVEGIEMDASLDVFDLPGGDAKVVGYIPSFAEGIVALDACETEWCHVRYLGLVGWVQAKHLVAENAPGG